MRGAAKKCLVLLPVILLGIFYLYDHYDTYRQVRNKRLVFLALTLCILYGWIFIEVMVRKQKGFFQVATQASYFLYIFMVLTLTGYFVLFREVSANGWWEKMMLRVERKDHVNLELFKIFDIYQLSNTQIVGNLLLLLPLGIYLPLLYKKSSNFFAVLIISVMVSTVIELLQLITRHRSADVDDILLNTMGACVGFVVYKLMVVLIDSPSERRPAAVGS